jgi:hypothetical protein
VVVIEEQGIKYYMDNKLYKALGTAKKKVQKDDDLVIAVSGGEGAGKSVFSMQLARRLDPSFCLERVCFHAKEFENAVLTAKPNQAIVYDEAFRGLSSRASLSGVNKQLVGLMQEMRQLNLFIIIVLPSFFLLDWYVAVHRAVGLFYVYRKKGRRGYWVYLNRRKKNELYELPRHLRAKRMPTSGFRGRFLEDYVVDEQEYRIKKKKSLRSTSKPEKHDKTMHQRNLLLSLLVKDYGITLREVSEKCKEKGWTVHQSTISKAIN